MLGPDITQLIQWIDEDAEDDIKCGIHSQTPQKAQSKALVKR
jgi:hypothetical protein